MIKKNKLKKKTNNRAILFLGFYFYHLSQRTTKPIIRLVRPAKTQIRVCLLNVPSTASWIFPSRKHAYIILTPINPTFISKTGVYMGIYSFSYFCSKTYIVCTR